MTTLTVSEARSKLYGLVDEVASEHKPITIKENPFQNPPSYEKLVGDLSGTYSRRINIQYRLVYQVFKDEQVVKIIRMWIHYEKGVGSVFHRQKPTDTGYCPGGWRNNPQAATFAHHYYLRNKHRLSRGTQ